jgi:DNA-binding MarR family transcriptional regulator
MGENPYLLAGPDPMAPARRVSVGRLIVSYATGPVSAAPSQAPDLERFSAAWEEFTGALLRARSRAWRQPAPLTPAQYYLLLALSHEPNLGVGEMAAAAGCTSPTATRMLDGLERDGVVVREPSAEDRRRTIVSLTAKGKRLLAEQRRRHDEKKQRLYEQLSPAERGQTEDLLHRLAEVIADL